MKNKAQLFHFDLYGKREDKYNFLNENTLASVQWTALQPNEPNFFFVNKNMQGKEEYEKGFKVDELFKLKNVGIATGKDSELVSFNEQNISSLFNNKATTYHYRPFDFRFTIFDKKVLQRARFDVMQHLISRNLALQITSKNRQISLGYFFISKYISDRHLLDSAADSMSVFPLYLYPESGGQQSIEQTNKRTPNLNMEIVQQIADKLGLTFVPDYKAIPEEFQILVETKLPGVPYIRPFDWRYLNCFTPLDLLDYIYAVLHSPTYREQYKEFLKIDFPRVPYPKDADTFWRLVNLGGEIREMHLLESSKVEQYITQYPEDGDNIVTKPKYQDGKVYINETQYFDNVPQIAWEFYIGGYQPAQKWLKDRKDRQLEFEDILHYQKIIVALTETNSLMQEIDKIHDSSDPLSSHPCQK